MGRLAAELLEAVKIVDVLAPDLSFVGSHVVGLVASVLPDLEFEIGAASVVL